MYNESVLSVVLTLHSLELPQMSIYPVFILTIITYLMVLLCNLAIVVTICLNRSLYKPMYILLINLAINDTIGATSLFPHLLYSIWSQDRSMSYPVCLFQAFFVHLYSGASHVILMAMAFDRYIAICLPLRYGAIMTSSNLARIIFVMWFINFLLIFVIFCLLMPYRICQNYLADLVCYNASLMKIVCENTTVNNIYGLFSLSLYHSVSLSFVAFTYIHILICCVKNKQSDTKIKALQTCGTHLVVFVFLEFNTLFPLIAHRAESIPAHLRRVFSISILVFPPIVNPLIYGFKTKEIMQNMITTLSKRKINKM